MKRHLAMLLLCSVAGGASGASGNESSVPTSNEILSALSARTHITKAELQTLLSHCDADQQSMTLCTYRDFEAANLTLKRLVAEKEVSLPACKAFIENKVILWKKMRDQGCERSAAKDYDQGSIQPMAQAMCATVETKKMQRWINAIKQCKK
jgi:hypothetical protein